MTDASSILALFLWFLEVASLLYLVYRGGLGLLGLKAARHLPAGPGEARFLVLVPAKDEAEVIGETVECILALDYPKDRFSLVVVADNCKDATKELARASGATVLAKLTPSFGKGSTVQWALANAPIVEAAWDALIMFDADSRPQADFLRVMEAALVEGDRAIQGRTESHGQHGWVPTAYAMNTSQRNRVWHQAREAAGFSAALTGTGVCLARELLQRFPPVTHTLTEDLEYGAILTRAGIRLRYVYDAVTVVDQPPSLKASVGQRLRWARGQLLTAFAYMPSLIWRAVGKRDLSAFDMALYLLLPSIVPFQAFLVLSEAGHLLVPDLWPLGESAGLPNIPFLVYVLILAFGPFLSFLALRIEKTRYRFRDWVAFGLLMVTWIAIAVFAAMTTWVTTWHRTPRASREEQMDHLQGEPEAKALREKRPGLADR